MDLAEIINLFMTLHPVAQIGILVVVGVILFEALHLTGKVYKATLDFISDFYQSTAALLKTFFRGYPLPDSFFEKETVINCQCDCNCSCDDCECRSSKKEVKLEEEVAEECDLDCENCECK